MKTLNSENIRGPISGVPGARLDIIEVFSEIESTNNYLLDQPGPPPGRFRVALADFQTAGRGRHDRTWQSPPSSGLCLSMSYTFPTGPGKLAGLTLALGIGVVEALKRLGIGGISLKWPNDLIAAGGKLGGILTEVQSGATEGVTIVVGIGLNVDLPESMKTPQKSLLSNKAVDLKLCTAAVPSRETLSVALIESLFDCMLRFEAAGFTPFQDQWRRYDWLKGREISAEISNGHVSGIADGVDTDGALVIQTNEGRRRIISASIKLAHGPDDA